MRRRSAGGSRDQRDYKQLLLILVAPFVLGLVLILALYGRTSAGSHPARALTAVTPPGHNCPTTAAVVQEAPACNCSQQVRSILCPATKTL